MLLNKRLVIAIGAFFSVVSIALAVIPQTQTPLCADGQTAFVSLDNTSGNSGFYACYVKPESYQLKIVKVSLVKADGSGNIDVYTPSTPTYQDLISGEVNLLQDLDLSSGTYDGTYSGIEIIFDNDILIKAKASYTGSDLPNWSTRNGTTGYCHTLAYTSPNYISSFAGSGNGNPTKFGDSPSFVDSEGASFSNPGLTTFRYMGSPMVGAGITGVDRVYLGSSGTSEGAYWAKVTYVTTGDASTADFSVLDGSYAETRRPELYDATLNRNVRNALYAKYKFNFANSITINSSAKQIVEIKFDLNKAIGFAWNYSSSGDGNYVYTGTNHSDSQNYYYDKGRGASDYEESANGYPDCLRMFIGQINLAVTLTSL
jgi:hypothetical protein